MFYQSVMGTSGGHFRQSAGFNLVLNAFFFSAMVLSIGKISHYFSNLR